jgi:hypothetical protein
VTQEQDEFSIHSLIEPFTHIANGDDELVATLLQATVEEALRSLVEDTCAMPERTKHVDSSGTSRSDAFSIVVPTIAGALGISSLRDEVLVHVGDLRNVRDTRAHGSESTAAVSAEQAAAAVFTVIGVKPAGSVSFSASASNTRSSSTREHPASGVVPAAGTVDTSPESAPARARWTRSSACERGPQQ